MVPRVHPGHKENQVNLAALVILDQRVHRDHLVTLEHREVTEARENQDGRVPLDPQLWPERKKLVKSQ